MSFVAVPSDCTFTSTLPVLWIRALLAGQSCTLSTSDSSPSDHLMSAKGGTSVISIKYSITLHAFLNFSSLCKLSLKSQFASRLKMLMVCSLLSCPSSLHQNPYGDSVPSWETYISFYPGAGCNYPSVAPGEQWDNLWVLGEIAPLHCLIPSCPSIANSPQILPKVDWGILLQVRFPFLCNMSFLEISVFATQTGYSSTFSLLS